MIMIIIIITIINVVMLSAYEYLVYPRPRAVRSEVKSYLYLTWMNGRDGRRDTDMTNHGGMGAGCWV